MIVYAFVILLLAGIAVRFWLASRQIRHVSAHRTAVPAEFSARISLHSHQRAADYTIARAKLGMYERLFDAAVLVGLTLLGGLQAIDTFVGYWIAHDLGRQLALIVSVALLLGGLGLPFTLYRQFVLEARFGFNRMTALLFVQDTLKGIVVGAIVGLPLTAVVLWL
jgi:STE24 endopeptidase